MPVRLVLLNIPPGEAYSLESVAKYGICKCGFLVADPCFFYSIKSILILLKNLFYHCYAMLLTVFWGCGS